jgi:phosphatidylglycerol---prolipoprotein diacylglyceryl transferase
VHPNLFHIGHLTLPTFGALAAIGLILAIALSQRTARIVSTDEANIDPDKLWDAGLFAILAAFILSRVLLVATHFAAFQQFPILLLAVPSLTPTGLLLTAIATFLWLHFKRIPILPALDAWVPCATLVWAFLALGHFAEASDPGLPTNLPWGVPMPGEATPLHPVAIYAAVTALILTAASYANLKRTQTAALTLIAAGTAQFLLSFLRQPGIATIAGLDALQLVALGMVLAGCVLAVCTKPASRYL